jgi:hypothetical protein
LSRRNIGGIFLCGVAAPRAALTLRAKEQAMVEDDVLNHLRALLHDGAHASVDSCRISMPVQHPWGKPYRLVEWTMNHDEDARRQVVPADSTPFEIALIVAQHVPGRRIMLNGEPIPSRAQSKRRTAPAA